MKLLLAVTVAALVAVPTVAAPCRDAKGHFIKCPQKGTGADAPTITKDVKGRCHAAGGKFVTCPK